MSSLIKLRIAFLCIISIGSLLALPASAEPSKQDIERNQIRGGNNSVNIIATGSSKVLVFQEADGTKTFKDAKQLILQLRKTDPELFENAEKKLHQNSSVIIDQIALANYTFQQGQYSLSASLFEKIIENLKLQDDGYNYIEGLTTASFFGSGRHVQGLQFICKQYKSRPLWSHRFRHDIHAHLRALTHKFGHEYAKSVLTEIRKNPKCQRDDFSEVWIPIHLSDMRAIEAGKPPGLARYGFANEKDKEYADRLIRDGRHHFLDYLYFIRGDFKNVIDHYPRSYVVDLALLGMARAEDPVLAIKYLQIYLNKYPESKLKKYVYKSIFKAAAITKDKKTIDYIINNYFENLREIVTVEDQETGVINFVSSTEVAVYENFRRRCINQSRHFNNLNFRAIAKSYRILLNDLTALYGDNFAKLIPYEFLGQKGYLCGIDHINSQSLHDTATIFENFDQTLVQNMETYEGREKFGRLFKACGDYRENIHINQMSKSDLQTCEILSEVSDYNFSFHRQAAKIFESIYDDKGGSAHELLFLAALSYKHNSDYAEYLSTMKRYAFENPYTVLSDDALAEIGWYYLVIEQTPAKSDQYFENVIQNYRQTNAYDNALNWLVISKKNQGQYRSSFKYAISLAKYLTSQRISNKISGRYEKIRTIAANFDTDHAPIKVGVRWRWSTWGVAGYSDVIIADSSNRLAKDMPKGSQIHKINGQKISSSDEFYLLLHQAVSAGQSNIKIVMTPKDDWQSYSITIAASNFGSIH